MYAAVCTLVLNMCTHQSSLGEVEGGHGEQWKLEKRKDNMEETKRRIIVKADLTLSLSCSVRVFTPGWSASIFLPDMKLSHL